MSPSILLDKRKVSNKSFRENRNTLLKYSLKIVPLTGKITKNMAHPVR